MAVFSTINIVILRQMSSEVHVALRTYYLGLVATAISLLWTVIGGIKEWLIYNIFKGQVSWTELFKLIIPSLFSWFSLSILTFSLIHFRVTIIA